MKALNKKQIRTLDMLFDRLDKFAINQTNTNILIGRALTDLSKYGRTHFELFPDGKVNYIPVENIEVKSPEIPQAKELDNANASV